MKTLIILLFLTLLACQKEKRSDWNIIKDVSLKSTGCPKNLPPSTFHLKYDYFDKTDNEMLADIKENTFERWIMPGDTIWLVKNAITITGEKLSIPVVFADSVYEISKESVGKYHCN